MNNLLKQPCSFPFHEKAVSRFYAIHHSLFLPLCRIVKLICSQLTGFYVMTTLAFNELIFMWEVNFSFISLLSYSLQNVNLTSPLGKHDFKFNNKHITLKTRVAFVVTFLLPLNRNMQRRGRGHI